MAIDPRISLAADAGNLGGAIGQGLLNARNIQAIQDRPLQNKLLKAETGAAEQELSDAQQLAEIRSMVKGAEDARLALEKGGREGLRNSLQARLGAGPTVEGGRGMVDTEEFLSLVDNPEVTDEQIIGQLDKVRDLGVRFGAIEDLSRTGAESPSSVREFEFFNNLNPDQQAEFLRVKRADRLIDTGGGGKAIVTPTGELQEVVSSEDATQREVEKTQQTAAATETGKAEGQVQALPEIRKVIKEKEQERLLAEENIQDLKNSKMAEGERQKLLGRERGQIATNIRESGRVASRSKPNVLRLKNALELVNTGKIAQARELMGGLIPGVKDADAEVFNSLATQFALDELSKQSGTKTDFDFQKAAETQARLGNTKEANRIITNIALDRIDEVEQEARQFREFVDKGGKAEDFEYTPPNPEHVNVLRANPTEKLKKDFKAKYGYIPTGL